MNHTGGGGWGGITGKTEYQSPSGSQGFVVKYAVDIFYGIRSIAARVLGKMDYYIIVLVIPYLWTQDCTYSFSKTEINSA